MPLPSQNGASPKLRDAPQGSVHVPPALAFNMPRTPRIQFAGANSQADAR